MLQLTAANITALLVAVAVSMGLMMLWYSKYVLGNAYMKACKMKESDCKGSINNLLLEAVTTLVTVIVMSIVIVWADAATWVHGLITGLIVAVGFGVTQGFSCYLWSKEKSFNLFLIKSGAILVNYAAIGAILAGIR